MLLPTNLNRFICSGESNIKNIIEVMREVRPTIVIIDSVNEIEEFENGNKKEARNLINGREGEKGLRDICQEIGCHLILLSQLNQDGSIKGGTSLPHLVDIALDIESFEVNNPSLFTISVGIKHRYGRRGPEFNTVWQHLDDGVQCISENRLKDKIWLDTHNIILPPKKLTLDEEIEVFFNSKKYKDFCKRTGCY